MYIEKEASFPLNLKKYIKFAQKIKKLEGIIQMGALWGSENVWGRTCARGIAL